MWIAVCIGAATGVGWVAVSYAMEFLFPMGDWRWYVLAAIAFAIAGAAYFRQRRQQLRVEAKTKVGSTKPPKHRVDKNTTYREYEGGWRRVTKKFWVKPVWFGKIGEATFRDPEPVNLTRAKKGD